MLNEFWAGKGKDLRTWSQEMEELEGLYFTQAKASQERRNIVCLIHLQQEIHESYTYGSKT